MPHRLTPPLACTVRGCGRPLTRVGDSWGCENHHVFDIARSGYVNLLQPQDRRSLAAGDTKAAVEARARLIAGGVGGVVLTQLVEIAVGHLTSARAVVADLGCGSGETLDALARRCSITGIGLDLSTHAVHRAARRFPDLTWAVANADRRLPLLDEQVDLVLSQQGRRNPPECARVLKPGGHLLIAVPAPDDLFELREAVEGLAIERDRLERVIEEHAPYFQLALRTDARERPTLDRPALLDLLTGTYRGARTSVNERVEGLERLAVTLSSGVCLLSKRR